MYVTKYNSFGQRDLSTMILIKETQVQCFEPKRLKYNWPKGKKYLFPFGQLHLVSLTKTVVLIPLLPVALKSF